MPAFLKMALLAIVQGATEFLPISSSGHLILGKSLLGMDSPGHTLEIVLHVGTLVSVITFYRHRLWWLLAGALRGEREQLTLAGSLLLSTLPAILLYFVAGSQIERMFDDPAVVGPALCVTGVVLLASCRISRSRESSEPIGWKPALLIGCAQAVALVPGISRSGSTISAAQALRVAPRRAAEFSFMMSIPLIAGSALLLVVKSVGSGGEAARLAVWQMVCGAGIAAVTGYLMIGLLVRMLARGRFWLFGLYCIAAGVLATVKLTF
jgi:undecaprenyl-diphosphatase